MQSKNVRTVAFVVTLGASIGMGAARCPAQNPPPSPPSGQSAPGHPNGSPAVAIGAMNPETMQNMMQMMGQVPRRSQGAVAHNQQPANPLQQLARLMSALEDPDTRKTLGISDQQAASLHKIVIDTETFTITTGATIAVDSIQLHELLRADKPDRAAVMAKGDEISQSTSQLISRYLETILSAKEILTPEQQKALRDYAESGAPARPSQAP